MSLFCFPICGGPLERGPSACFCPAGHSFDLAREGYVHLLPANRMHSKMPGDDKGMAAARRESWLIRKMTSDNKAVQGCLNALKQPQNGGYTDRPREGGEIRLTINLAGVGGEEAFK